MTALSTTMQEQRASSVPSSSVTQLQESLDSALAQIDLQKQQVENIQVRAQATPANTLDSNCAGVVNVEESCSQQLLDAQ